MHLAILLLASQAMAEEAILITHFEGAQEVPVRRMVALPKELGIALDDDYQVLTARDVAYIKDMTGQAYLQACAPEDLMGCSFKLGQTAEARFALTGRVRSWAIDEEEGTPVTVELVVSVLDVPEVEEAAELVFPYEGGAFKEFPAGVLEALEALLQGRDPERTRFGIDQAPEEVFEPEIYDPELDPDAMGRTLDGIEDEADSDLDGPRREDREKLTMEQLLETKGEEEPWERLDLSARQYLSWWNSGWDLASWRQRVRGRRGQLLVRVAAGAGNGPGSAYYLGRVARESNQLLEHYSMRQLESAWASSLGLQLGFGLLSFLELEAGIGREGGSFKVDVIEEWGDVSEEYAIQSEHVNSNLALQGGLRLVPLPLSSLRPVLGAGFFAMIGANVARYEELPIDELWVFDSPSFIGLYAQPGLELRLARRLDLFFQAPIRLLLKGGEGELVLSDDSEDALLLDKQDPSEPSMLAFALQAGVQLRIGK